MAWELAYTSVAAGPTGRSGFQFVAVAPGTPPEVPRLVTPYMTYRPPPGAPAAPDDEELAAFPTALTYGREGGYLVLACCRYTGRDYSGRYGNFLGRAVVARPEEMEGLRPIEFWRSPLWDRPPTGDPRQTGDDGPYEARDDRPYGPAATPPRPATGAAGRSGGYGDTAGAPAGGDAAHASRAGGTGATRLPAAPVNAPSWGGVTGSGERAAGPPPRSPGPRGRPDGPPWAARAAGAVPGDPPCHGDRSGVADGDTAAAGRDGAAWAADGGAAGHGEVRLAPGAAFDPDALVAWLAREGEHDRLAALLDAVAGALTGGHGRVVLVSADVERIARWIALVSYSLPAELAAGLSFTTYTDDPDAAPQLLVGTVPSAFARGGFRLDEPAAAARPGRFARTLAGCWRRGDLDGIDAIGACVAPPAPAHPGDDADPHDPADPYQAGPHDPADPYETGPRAAAEAHDAPLPARDSATPSRGHTPGGGTSPGGRAPGGARPYDAPRPRAAGRSSRSRNAPHDGAGYDGAAHDGAPRPHGAGGARRAVPEPAPAAPCPAGVLDAARLDAAAALLALCRGDASVSAGEQAAAAALVRERGAPSWVWPALSGTLPAVGFDLAAALAGTAAPIDERCVRLALADPARARRLPPVRSPGGLPDAFRAAVATAGDLPALADVLCLAERVGGAVEPGDVTAAAAACARRGAGAVAGALRAAPESWREPLAAGVLAGLETAEPDVRRAMLTPEACAALGDRDWSRAPRTGGVVLAAGPDRRAATAGLVRLEPYGVPDLDALLAGLWEAPPSAAECRWLVDRLPEAVLRFGPLRAVTRTVFEVLPVDAEETVRLAALIRDRLPVLAGPARTVLACDAALRAGSAREVVRALEDLAADGPPAARARAAVARALRARSPAARARVLAAVPAVVRDDLAAHWVAAGPDRHESADLAEIEARLAGAEVDAAPLRAWADGLGRFARRRVESALTDRDPGLAAAWRARRREA